MRSEDITFLFFIPYCIISISISMKKPNIQKRHRAYNPMKGINYANRQARNMFMVVFAVFGVVMILSALLDHSFLAAFQFH